MLTGIIPKRYNVLMANTTIDYYNAHAEEYSASTLHADMSYVYQRVSFYLHKGDRILDLGCGSGRDTIWFLHNGYQTDAADGSKEMASTASENAGIPVRTMMFSELQDRDVYNGIFACASLLHVPYAELTDIFIRIFQALKREGIVYASFPYGESEGYEDERYYTEMNEIRLLNIMKPHLDEWTVLELWHSHDTLAREKIWFNMILRRIR